MGASSSTLSQADFNKMLAASGGGSCQCDLSQVKADISSNTDQINSLSTNSISDTVISEMNKDGPIKTNITKQITDTVQQNYVKSSDLNSLISQQDGKIVIGTSDSKGVQIASGDLTVTGDVNTTGNVVGSFLVASGTADWGACDGLLNTYPQGSVYMGGGQDNQDPKYVMLGMCSRVGDKIRHVHVPKGNDDASNPPSKDSIPSQDSILAIQNESVTCSDMTVDSITASGDVTATGKIQGDSLTSTTKGITINGGGMNVNGGGITVSAGDIQVTGTVNGTTLRAGNGTTTGNMYTAYLEVPQIITTGTVSATNCC